MPDVRAAVRLMLVSQKFGFGERYERKLTARQRTHLLKLHQAADDSLAEVAALFDLSSAVVYRDLARTRSCLLDATFQIAQPGPSARAAAVRRSDNVPWVR